MYKPIYFSILTTHNFAVAFDHFYFSPCYQNSHDSSLDCNTPVENHWSFYPFIHTIHVSVLSLIGIHEHWD